MSVLEAPETVETNLPPRPDLSRWMMRAGFIFQPTKFLEQAHERMGDYFTLLPAPGRVLVVTVDPAAVKQVFTGDPALLHAGRPTSCSHRCWASGPSCCSMDPSTCASAS
jgi:hypothetical protein